MFIVKYDAQCTIECSGCLVWRQIRCMPENARSLPYEWRLILHARRLSPCSPADKFSAMKFNELWLSFWMNWKSKVHAALADRRSYSVPFAASWIIWMLCALCILAGHTSQSRWHCTVYEYTIDSDRHTHTHTTKCTKKRKRIKSRNSINVAVWQTQFIPNMPVKPDCCGNWVQFQPGDITQNSENSSFPFSKCTLTCVQYRMTVLYKQFCERDAMEARHIQSMSFFFFIFPSIFCQRSFSQYSGVFALAWICVGMCRGKNCARSDNFASVSPSI